MSPKKTQILPLYVITGKETDLVRRRAQELVETLLSPDQHTLALFKLEGKDAQIAEVLDECRTLPFLADRRVVVVYQADSFISANRSLLEEYFDHPCPSGVLILCTGTWQATTKLAKKLTRIGQLIKLDPPKPWQMPKALCDYTQKQHGKTLSLRAAQLLVQLAGDDWIRVQTEVDKLALFVGRSQQIDTVHIEKLVGHNRVFGAFDVIESVVAGRQVEAVARLRNLFSEDPASQYTVVGAFAFHLRRLFNARVMMNRGHSPDQISKALRLWGRQDAFFAQVRGVSLERIGALLCELAEIDFQSKTGQGRIPVAIEQLVMGMTATRRSQSRMQ